MELVVDKAKSGATEVGRERDIVVRSCAECAEAIQRDIDDDQQHHRDRNDEEQIDDAIGVVQSEKHEQRCGGAGGPEGARIPRTKSNVPEHKDRAGNHSRTQVERQEFLRAVDRFDFRSGPPDDEHVENDVLPFKGMQKRAGQEPPDLTAMDDGGGVDFQPLRHRTIDAVLSRRQLQNEHDDVGDNDRLPHLAGAIERTQKAPAFIPIVLAVVNAHDHSIRRIDDATMFYQIGGGAWKSLPFSVVE